MTDAVSPVTSYFTYDAQNKALSDQQVALRKLQGLDPNVVNDTASNFDKQRYEAGFNEQNSADPIYAALRTQGGQSVLDNLNAANSGNTAADQAIAQLQTAASDNNSQMSPLISQLVSRAQTDLNEGSTLDPSFQAELVRSGLASTGASGVNLDGSATAGSNIRRLLGSEGVALQQSRAAEAQNLLGSASNLQAQRANILSNLVTLDQNLRTSKSALGLNAATLGNGTVPGVGITGADAANILSGNQNLKNQVTLGKGALQGQKALNTSQFINNEINSGAKLIGDVAGAYFGGGMGGMMGGGASGAASGAAGSGGSGMMSFLNGFMQNQGVGYTGGSTNSGGSVQSYVPTYSASSFSLPQYNLSY